MSINKEFKQEFKNAMASHAYWLRGGNYYGERATFENADFSNVSFDRYSLKYVSFNNCNLGGIHGVEKFNHAVLKNSTVTSMFEGTCEDVTFSSCKLNAITHAIFNDCSFKHCNLRKSHIGYVIFRKCDFYAADFTGCTFEGVRFVDCKNVPKNALT